MIESAISERVDQASSRQLFVNIGSNIAVLFLNIVVGLWFTPYLIGVLGVAVFGISTLALSISNYMAIFDSALNNAIGRFLAIEIRNSDLIKANRTFNSAFWLAIIISLILLPLILLLSFYSPQLFSVPSGQENPTRWVFLLAMISYVLFFIRGVFSGATFARNRLDLQNGVLAGNILVRVVATVALLSLAAIPTLIHVGAGLLLGTIFSLSLSILVLRHLIPQIKIHPRYFQRAELGILFGMSGWVFVNQMGSVLFLNVDQIIVNKFLGATVQGGYASALQWSVLLRSLARTFSTALAPIMVWQFAAGDKIKLGQTSVLSVKSLGLIMSLPVGLIAGLAAPLLRLWLGTEFENLSFLLVLLVVPLSINLAILPLYSLQIAYNRVKIPGIVSLLSGALNLVIALWWVNWWKYGIGVAAASALVLTLRSAIFTPLYGAHIQKLPWHSYYPGLVSSGIVTLVVMAGSWWLAHQWTVNSWIQLIGIGAAMGTLYILIVYFLALSASEKDTLRQLLKRRAKRPGSLI